MVISALGYFFVISFLKKEKTEMNNILGELYIMDQMGIKPNYSALSREYKIDRHTIKKYHSNGGIIRKKPQRKSKYDPYFNELVELLSRPGVSIKAAFEYLKRKFEKEGKEFNITYTGVRHYLYSKGIRPVTNKPQVHIRYETPPGQQLQIDWKENMKITTIQGEVIEFNVLSGTLGYSRLHTLVYSETRTTEDLIRCLIETLKKLGGVPKSILTDNMASIVSIHNNLRTKHSRIIQLEKDLGIDIKLCKVKTPQTKGKDESANRFLNWLVPYDGKIKDKEELIQVIEDINQRINEQNNQTTQVPPIALFQKEKEYLAPLPNEILLENYIVEVKTQTVPPTLLVRYKGAEYSVAKQFINKRVKLIPIEDKLYIYHNTQIIAIHQITHQKINYDPHHYIDALRTAMGDGEEIEKIAAQNLELLKGIGKYHEQL